VVAVAAMTTVVDGDVLVLVGGALLVFSCVLVVVGDSTSVVSAIAVTTGLDLCSRVTAVAVVSTGGLVEADQTSVAPIRRAKRVAPTADNTQRRRIIPDYPVRVPCEARRPVQAMCSGS